MERAKQLPYTEPPFCTYQYLASNGIAALGNPTAIHHYLNQSIVLSCTRKFLSGFTTPEISVNGGLLCEMDFMEHFDVSRRFADGCEFQMIRNMIDEGYYVIFNMVDVFYIDGMMWSGEKHYLHDGLICGYDDNDHTLTIASYDNRWIFRPYKTSQESFLKALNSAKEMGACNDFTLLRAHSNEITLNLSEMAKYMEEYLDSTLLNYPFDGDGLIHGIIVHDYMRLYLTYILEGEIPYDRMDKRVMRLLWEHKKCMTMRIEAIEKLLGVSDELSKRYAKTEARAAQLCTLYASCKIKRRDDLLAQIRDEIGIIKSEEIEILPIVLKLIKEAPNAVESSET